MATTSDKTESKRLTGKRRFLMVEDTTIMPPVFDPSAPQPEGNSPFGYAGPTYHEGNEFEVDLDEPTGQNTSWAHNLLMDGIIIEIGTRAHELHVKVKELQAQAQAEQERLQTEVAKINDERRRGV